MFPSTLLIRSRSNLSLLVSNPPTRIFLSVGGWVMCIHGCDILHISQYLHLCVCVWLLILSLQDWSTHNFLQCHTHPKRSLSRATALRAASWSPLPLQWVPPIDARVFWGERGPHSPGSLLLPPWIWYWAVLFHGASHMNALWY